MSSNGCKNSTATGCRCTQHDPGLAMYARDPIAYEQMLERWRQQQPASLRVVTMPLPGDPEPCNGSMTCGCAACQQERNAAANRASRPRPKQPWDVAA